MIGVMAAVWAGACASGGQTLADRFVSQGTPAVDLGGPRLVSSRASKAKDPLKGTTISNVASRRRARCSAVEGPRSRAAGGAVPAAAGADGRPSPAGGQRLPRRSASSTARTITSTRSLTLNGSGPGVYDARGAVVARLGQPGQRSVARVPGRESRARWPVAQNTLGTLLFRLGHRADARTRFDAAVRLDPRPRTRWTTSAP